MERGKLEISCGYTCDTEEKPGTHPIWGDYDAIQRNILGNHVAIVDQGRAGTAKVRMDGMMVQRGTGVARDLGPRYNARAMPSAARIDVVVRTDQGTPSATAQVDPDDLATRNAAGKTSAKPEPKRQPGQMSDEDEDPDDDDEGDDDEGGTEDAYDVSYDDDGDLTAEARNKIKASNFAVPDQEKLPIHDKPHVRAAMSRFGQTDFSDPDEKHAAFNRIKSKAKQFNISTTGFEKAHAGKLDRADAHKEPMKTADQTKAEKDAKKAKKAERKAKLDAARTAADDAKTALAKAEGERDTARADAKAAKDALEAAKTAGTTDVASRVDAKVELLFKATATGAKVDSKMTDRAIKVAVIKHVDKVDVADDKHDAYVDALYDGAIGRAKTDASATAAGAAALAAARQTVAGDPTNPARNDAADDTDEGAAMRRLRTTSANAHNQPSRLTKGSR